MTNLRAFLVLLFAVLQMVAGFAPALFGVTNDVGAMVEPYRTPLVPAGWAFAIWGLLYLGCLIFALHHVMHRNAPGMARVGWLALLAFFGCSVWVPHQLTFGPDWVSFIGLEIIGVAAIAAAFSSRRLERTGPFRTIAFGSLWALAGWITVASAAGFSLSLVFSNGWDLGPSPTDAVFPILLAWLPIAWALSWLARSFFFVGPIIWGLYGVAMANTSEQTFFIGVLALATSFLGITLIAKGRAQSGRSAA